MKKCLLGVVSWCDSTKYPQRFRIFRQMVKSIEEYVPRDVCLTAVVDNNSSKDVQNFISSSSVFDVKVLLLENTHDVGAYSLLARIAEDNKLPYIWLLENDYLLLRKAPLEDIFEFLAQYSECGYVRLQKFQAANKTFYDKLHKYEPNHDPANAVWLKNIVTDEELKLSKPIHLGTSQFYITNWHFGLHGGLIPTRIWKKIAPKLSGKVPYYYKFEEYVRLRYNKLKLKTGFLDGGVFSMADKTVYQKATTPPIFEKITQKLSGLYGGYTDGQVIADYCEHYKNYGPIQIQLFSNSLGVEELQLLKEVFASHWLGYGPKSRAFETQFANSIGSKYALGITSCTSGLFMSMEILGIKSGDEVIMPTVGFVGAANAVLKSGARPVFADVDPHYLNILPGEVERLITSKTKAIMLLHYGGIPARVNEIKAILKRQKQKIYLIEDSANSIKSLYHTKYCGTLGDIGLFSLDANKVITTGTGGILVTNDDYIYHQAQITRFYGLTPSHATGYDAMRARKKRWWEIELEYPGNRYLINDITSAIALAQLPKLDRFVQKRKQIWKYYQNKLAKIPNLILPSEPPKGTTSSYYFYWVRVRDEKEQLSLAEHLVQNGIYTTFRYYPLHLVDFYKSSSVKLPYSEKIAQTTLNLPFHQNLSVDDLDRIVKTLYDWAQNRQN